MVAFTEVGSNRSPNNPTEFASAGPVGDAPKVVVIVAHRLSTGTIAANTPVEITGETQGDAYHGVGSPCAEMCRAYKALDPNTKLLSVGITAAGSAAAGSLGFSGTATAKGSLDFLIGGRLYQLAVESGTAAAAILTAYKALIAADPRRQLDDGTIGSGAIPLTARVTGPIGNSLSISQVSPSVPGITVTIVQPTSGATEASLATAISALAADQYFDIVGSFNDSTSLTAIETEMDSRFTANRESGGVYVTAMNGSVSALTTVGDARNSRHICMVDAGLSPTPFWIVAAQAAARDASLSDPGQPRYGLTLPGVIAPIPANRRTHAERNTLLADGISTTRVLAGDVVAIDRLVTMYQEDGNAIEDDTYRSIESMHVLHAFRASKKALTAKYATYKLVDDGTVLDQGVLAVTPSEMRGILVEHYNTWCKAGNMEDLAGYEAGLVVERSSTDRNRLNTQERVNLGNQLVTLAGKVIVAL